MAKIDQQALKKHHFWILLGVFALFILILVILVPVLIGSEISEKEAAYESALKKIEDSARSPTTQGQIKELEKQLDEVNNVRAIVWRQMFSRQAGVISFPEQLTARLTNAKFGSELEDRFRDLYRQDEVYAEAYRQMPAIVKPTEFAGGWPAVLQPVSWSSARLPTSEEIWLSLEDLCVRRELLHILREANDTPARFVGVNDVKESELPKSSLGPKFSKRLRNRLYEIDLAITEKERGKFFAHGKIRNISGRRQVIFQLSLDVWLNEKGLGDGPVQPVAVDFPLDQLAAGQEANLPEVPIIVNLPPEEIVRVQLRYNTKTVPIKRIDAILLGFNAGHRLADRRPTVSKFSTITSSAAGSGDGSEGGAMMGGGGAQSMPSSMQGAMQRMAGMMGGGPGGAGGQSGELTPNGIQKLRYIDVTDQVRRMPVAVVMIVDQANLQDVLAAFSNSKRLRFHLTQYHWTRHYGQATTVSAPGSGGSSVGPGALGGGVRGGESRGGLGFSAPGMGGFGPAPGAAGAGAGRNLPPDDGDVAAGGPAGGGGFAGGAPVGGTAGRQVGMGGGAVYVEQPQLSLVELTVYGVANLYEEPTGDEPKPLEPASPGESTTSAQPGSDAADGTGKPPMPGSTVDQPGTGGDQPNPDSKSNDSAQPTPAGTNDAPKPGESPPNPGPPGSKPAEPGKATPGSDSPTPPKPEGAGTPNEPKPGVDKPAAEPSTPPQPAAPPKSNDPPKPGDGPKP